LGVKRKLPAKRRINPKRNNAFERYSVQKRLKILLLNLLKISG
jgi:hypothetical protein